MALSLLLALVVGSVARPPAGINNIRNVVVLVQENLSFDHFAGGLTYNSSIDGLVNSNFCNPTNVSQPYPQQVCARSVAQNIASEDPNHSICGGNMQIFGTYHPLITSLASMQGFVTEQRASYVKHNRTRAAEVIDYFTPDHIPVFNALAENFVLFDRWFAAVPGPTNPNRAYLTSGTSYGRGKNDETFNISSLPQRSVFEQLTDKGITWKNYENSSYSDPPFLPDALFYRWAGTSAAAQANVVPIDRFYEDARNGNLPQFS
ncbi:uncharacterized protein N7459_005632 [Penicillium hispanicum]|uniref:uncharacterized protein n=1 Tax=Penicillium hispanicum TaxID=1080232 RepID=UPI0025404398|nr:uncharacterized protein N7459_005632 [Penicillium hispanicum]KAJ5579647.1 hypothetical protein N7459_005632 [Penicillium hispanicum]